MRVPCYRALDAGGCTPINLRRSSKLQETSGENPRDRASSPACCGASDEASLQPLPLPRRYPHQVTALSCPLASALKSSLEPCWDYKDDILSGVRKIYLNLCRCSGAW